MNGLAVSWTKQSLLELARAQGYSVTERQLARWHRAGLLPKPLKRSLGRGKGTASIYPDGTDKQLLALLRLKKIERRTLFLAWHLWWERYEVPTYFIRVMVEWAAMLYVLEVYSSIDQQKGGLTERAWELIQNSNQDRVKDETTAITRRRTGKKDYPILSRIEMQISAGQFEGFHKDHKTRNTFEAEEIHRKALGLGAAFDFMDIEQSLKHATKTIPKLVSKPISDYSDDDFLRARDYLLALKLFAEETKELKPVTDVVIPKNVPRNRFAQAFGLWDRLYRLSDASQTVSDV